MRSMVLLLLLTVPAAAGPISDQLDRDLSYQSDLQARKFSNTPVGVAPDGSPTRIEIVPVAPVAPMPVDSGANLLLKMQEIEALDNIGGAIDKLRR
jgi:hypothetical protein